MSESPGAFSLEDTFVPAALENQFKLGPLGESYGAVFAEVLADGVITPEERRRLNKAGEALGLDAAELSELERAMVQAFEARHRVRVVERGSESIAPPPPDESVASLRERVAELTERVRELEEELRRAQSSIAVEVDLRGLDSVQLPATDPDEAWRRVRRDPLNADALNALREALPGDEHAERRGFVLQALECLGMSQAKTEACLGGDSQELPRPSAGLSEVLWRQYLVHPEQEVTTSEILAVIAPAVLVGRAAVLHREGRLYQPKGEPLTKVGDSTVSAVRALAWASAILGIALPPIHIDREQPGGYVHHANVPPLTRVGPAALSGRTQRELAFLVGRHLALYRPDHYVRVLFPSILDLEDVFLSAVLIGNPRLALAADVKLRVEPIAKALLNMLEPRQVDALRGLLLRFVEEGGRTNLQRWAAAVDKTSCRVGLLLSGDLVTAHQILKSEASDHDELLGDLVSFATSPAFAALRRELGISLGARS